MTPPKEKKEGENVARQFKTIEFDDRKTIASMYANGAIAGEIAQKIGVSRTTVYTELKRGQRKNSISISIGTSSMCNSKPA